MSWVLERNVPVSRLSGTVLPSERWEGGSPGPRNLPSSLSSRAPRAQPCLVSSEGGHVKPVFAIGLAQRPQAAAATSGRSRPGIQGPSKALVTINIE